MIESVTLLNEASGNNGRTRELTFKIVLNQEPDAELAAGWFNTGNNRFLRMKLDTTALGECYFVEHTATGLGNPVQPDPMKNQDAVNKLPGGSTVGSFASLVTVERATASHVMSARLRLVKQNYPNYAIEDNLEYDATKKHFISFGGNTATVPAAGLTVRSVNAENLTPVGAD